MESLQTALAVLGPELTQRVVDALAAWRVVEVQAADAGLGATSVLQALFPGRGETGGRGTAQQRCVQLAPGWPPRLHAFDAACLT